MTSLKLLIRSEKIAAEKYNMPETIVQASSWVKDYLLIKGWVGLDSLFNTVIALEHASRLTAARVSSV